MSPLIKCPLPDENTKKQLANNQKKLLCLLEKEEVNNKETNYVFYSRFKYWNKGIKDFFKSFFKTIRIPFLNNKKEYVYIAFIPNGGIGDFIRQKSILNSMIDMNKNIIIDIYNKKSRKYGIFKDIEKHIRFFVNKNAVNITSLFYDIIISFEKYEDGVFLNFKKKTNKVFINKLKSNIQIYQNKYFHSFNNNFCISGRQDKIINRYKIICGVDDINSDNLKLLYNKSSLERFKIFNDTLYITFQNGHGLSSHKENTHIKCWDTRKWEELLSLLKTNLPDNIKLVQVGLDGYIFDKADIKLAGKTNFDELCSVLERSVLHIDADCGCVHICKALETTSLVLFGPTDINYLGYDNNINIASSLCGNCFRPDYSTVTKCPLGYSKPLCMESISPQFVFHTVTEYLKTKGIINNNDM